MEDRDRHFLSPQGKRYAVEMLTTLSPHQRVSWDKFAKHGMLLPLGAFNAHHNLQNPFLFNVDHRWRPESQLDPLQCWPRAEMIKAGEKCNVPSNDIYGALFFLIRQKLSECIQKLSKHRFLIVVTCSEPSALLHRLQQSKTAIHYISGVDATQLQYASSDDQELSALSVRALKEIIQGAGLSTEGCLEKSDLVDRAALILGRAAPSDASERHEECHGLLYWGLVMDSAYGDTVDACSAAWTSYYESACLGNETPTAELTGTNPTPAWWKSLRTVVELMEPSGGGTKSESKVSAEADGTFDTRKFAFEGVEKCMMQINLTPSNSNGLGDFSSNLPHHSFILRAESLALTSEERLQLQGKEITELLTRSRVITSVEVCGSYGKGTAVSGCADLDMVAITTKCFESDMYLSLQRHVASLLKDLKVDIKHKPLAVSFTYKHVGIDVVLASPNIEPLSQCYLPPRPRFFPAVQKVNATQFTEENVRGGFVTSLELLLQVISGNLKLYWVDNYPEYSIEFENHDGPIVMDPFDLTNNLAGLLQIQDWRPLSQLAEQTLIAIRDHNLMQRVIHITPTAEQRVSAISPQYRFSCFILRAEQFIRAGNLEEALDALAAASHFDNSNMKLQCMWYECITQLFAEEHGAKQSSLTSGSQHCPSTDVCDDAGMGQG
ncbi:hypothetical protein EMCRGX_G021332 [Ephydatia muelleri]